MRLHSWPLKDSDVEKTGVACSLPSGVETSGGREGTRHGVPSPARQDGVRASIHCFFWISWPRTLVATCSISGLRRSSPLVFAVALTVLDSTGVSLPSAMSLYVKVTWSWALMILPIPPATVIAVLAAALATAPPMPATPPTMGIMLAKGASTLIFFRNPPLSALFCVRVVYNR